MASKKILAAIAISAAVAGGGLAGALTSSPLISSAQEGGDTATTEGTTTDDTATSDADAPDDAAGRCGPGHHADLGVAAEALGMTEDELRAALDEDTSIADVATEQGVDLQTVIDAMVADATARIDEKVAAGDLEADRAAEIKDNLVERITLLVNHEGRFGGPGRGPGGPHPALDVVAEALGMTEDELRAALDEDTSIADVATEQGVDLQTVIDAMVADATARIDEKVAAGDLDADRAAEIKANLVERITELVNHEGRPGRPGGPRR